MKITFYTTAIILGLLLQPAYARALQCPEQIKTNQSLAAQVKGWDAFVDDLNLVYHAERVTFYAGHPKEHASLAPDNGTMKNGQLSWTFNDNEIWMACGYSHTSVQLVQKLSAKIKTCTVTYDSKMSVFPTVVAIQCI